MTLVSAKEKAQKIATEWLVKTGVLNPKSDDFNSLCAAIEVALKEQDRDTRHACAEAVLTAAETTLSDKGIHADTALLDFAEQPGVVIDGSGASEDGEQTCGWFVNGETYPGGMSLRQCLNDAMCKRADSDKAA